eukprot:1591303-Pyramimonas_sp.AAC.1
MKPPGGELLHEWLHVEPSDELHDLHQGLVLGRDGEGLGDAEVQNVREALEIARAIVATGLHRTYQ